jgi:valyl-tRNA synthetase
MQKELAKIYDPKTVEDKWYAYWQEHNYFRARVNPEKKPYAIVIPPPNVTSKLHMGHAFNNSLQDILIRYKRKSGFEALWLPGTDHAGIATQNMVERDLAKEGKTRHDLGRDLFEQRVWKWKEEHGSTIIRQLKKMGCSCDWERERFTLDEGLSNAVQEVFIRLYERGLIYKGLRIVNWDPASGTALSDDEVDHHEVHGQLYHLRYYFKNSNDYIVVATTRPETLLGDTAVAVSPLDEAKQALIGKTVVIPFVNREAPIISDEYVDKEFGSGFVKVTPAHDPNDFEMGLRHNLKQVIVMDKQAHIMQVCQVFEDGVYHDELPIPAEITGLDRFKARKKIVEIMEASGQVEKIEKHVHAVGHSYRSKVAVEPYLSVQWFVKMKPLAVEALRVVQDGLIKFYPEGRFEKIYEHWMNNIRDWCISRQLWWGHRIPAWYNEKGEVKVCAADPSIPGEKWTQEEDVLDTWFSSQLWPFSTLGWPDETPELKYFYPTDTLVTGPDIIFFWVARMVMAGMEFIHDIPFRQVYFNGIVRDEQGRKMSKSLGNGIDPLDIISEYSADAMRFTLIMLSSEGQDINVGMKSFELGRNFSNKIWNAFRFLYMNLDEVIETDYTPYRDLLQPEDRWILSRYHRAIAQVSASLDRFRANDAVQAIYHFFWHDYCDWHLEMIKKRLYRSQDARQKKTALAVACHVMKGSMSLLHPFIPFITEEIWQTFKTDREESIVISPWPQYNEALIDTESERQMEFLQEVISGIRNLRTEMNVPPAKMVSLYLKNVAGWKDNAEHLNMLAKVESIHEAGSGFDRNDAASLVIKGCEFYIPLAELIDREKEKQRLEKEIAHLQKLEQGIQSKLNNPNFTGKAPATVVQAEQTKLDNLRQNLGKVRKNYEKFI